MRLRSVVLVVAACAVLSAQTLTVQKVVDFIHSAAKQKDADKDVAEYLAKVKLSERLDDRTIEELQSSSGVGVRTLHALWTLRDQSKALPAPKAPAAAPVQANLPAPTSEEQAAILADVREYALNYSKDLPDFICTEVVKRAVALPVPHGADLVWRDEDTLQIKLSYFEQKEQYKLLMINSSITNKDYEAVGGAKSFGDFGSLLRGIFEPDTQARFDWDGWSRTAPQGAMVFRYFVEQPNSRYEIRHEGGQHIVPAYSGKVWVDKKSHKVLRVSVKAENIPADFPVKSALTTLDYDYYDLSGHTFLLPTESVVTMASDDHLSRNTATFHIYRKYTADSTLTFK